MHIKVACCWKLNFRFTPLVSYRRRPHRTQAHYFYYIRYDDTTEIGCGMSSKTIAMDNSLLLYECGVTSQKNPPRNQNHPPTSARTDIEGREGGGDGVRNYISTENAPPSNKLLCGQDRGGPHQICLWVKLQSFKGCSKRELFSWRRRVHGWSATPRVASYARMNDSYLELTNQNAMEPHADEWLDDQQNDT